MAATGAAKPMLGQQACVCANNILGLSRHQNPTASHSVEAEGEMYLNDTQTGRSSLSY